MRKEISLMLGVALCAPAAALAASPSYNYLGGDFIVAGEAEVDTPFGSAEEDYDGWDINGSLAITPNVFIQGEYTELEIDGGGDDVELFSGGLGLNAPLGTATPLDIYGMLTYERIETGDDDTDGLGLTGGLRWLATPRLEVAPYVGYVEYDDDVDGSRYGVDAVFSITPQFAVLAGYRSTQLEFDNGVDLDLENEISLGGRFYFGG